MFKKLKEKAVQTNNWVVEHKKEIFVGALVGVAGTLGVIAVRKANEGSVSERLNEYIDNCKPGDNMLVDVLKVERKADGMYWECGDNGPTIENLSASMLSDDVMPKDAKVIGALIYTKSE